ncbi:MAG: hypothetical protein IV105_06570 [Rhizobacter sp.]|nr:hypothetical protein [Rhizobacter sp.]
MSSVLPPLMRDVGMQFDLFIQALTEQLDKAQATMALKARVGKLPLTFAVKDVQIDLRAFVQIVDDDLYVRPAAAGESEASTIKLSLTTITRPMVEENSIDLASEDPKFSLREALGADFDEERRRLERIGVRTVTQLNELRNSAGADAIERLARLPVNRLQQALLRAAAPRVSQVRESTGEASASPRVRVYSPLLRAGGRLPLVQAAGSAVPWVESAEGQAVLQPLASQLGMPAQIDFGDGQVAEVALSDGAAGRWLHETPGATP